MKSTEEAFLLLRESGGLAVRLWNNHQRTTFVFPHLNRSFPAESAPAGNLHEWSYG